jgi:hypothetical protein
MRAQDHGDARSRGSCMIRVTSVPDEARAGTRQTAAIGRMRRPSYPRRSSSQESPRQQPCRDLGMGAGFDRDGRKHRPGANFAAGAASGKGAGLAYRVASAGERGRPRGPAGRWIGTDSTRLAGNLPFRERPRRTRPILSALRSREYNGLGRHTSRGIKRTRDDRSWTGGVARPKGDDHQGGIRWMSSNN